MAHVSSEQLWLLTQDLNKIKPAEIPAYMEEELVKSYP